MDYLIYLVEDDHNLNALLTTYLTNEGWSVRSFLTGSEAQKAIGDKPHLWILDIMLPGVDGYQLVEEIKNYSVKTPVIFISARDTDLDRIVGLEKGSDDYLAKPFSPRELVIRTRKLLARVYVNDDSSKEVLYSKYAVDIKGRTVLGPGAESVELTTLEFDLLAYFLQYKHQALSREQILAAVWGDGYFGADRVVDDLVRRLRKKMPLLNIETMYGFGYRLADARD